MEVPLALPPDFVDRDARWAAGADAVLTATASFFGPADASTTAAGVTD